MTQRLPTYFISHGGGPWPWLDDWRQMLHGLELSLADMPRQIGGKPKAVLMISGPWEEDAFAVMSSPRPPMVYDYYGFPKYTYDIVYPAPGDPVLAGRVEGLIAAAGLPTKLDPERGFDHGTFAPLAIMYPDADVPVIQVALKGNLDPAEHLALGRALAPLRDEGVLIVGSGFSFHNLRLMGPQGAEPSAAFDGWLQETVVAANPQAREAGLKAWLKAPAARLAHPREEHLLPLMVAVGAAHDDKATCVYHENTVFGAITASSFRFDAAA